VENEAQLLEILASAQAQGLLGPGDPAVHYEHALGFADAAESSGVGAPARFADLGTGGGVPGLILAAWWADASVALIESRVRRGRLLVGWVDDLGFGDRVQVLEGRAEDWARDPDYREAFDLVTARSFARPSVTAEIASGLVRTGGQLVVSEPPSSETERWPEDEVGALGFSPATALMARGAHYARLQKIEPAGGDVPRRAGKPGKSPLW
jgi:16S rRNA (guanine527-N7)-methyltransferase